MRWGAKAAAVEAALLIFQRGLLLFYAALAAALLVHPDPVLRERGWPLLAAAFAIGAAAMAFRLHATGLRCFPRRLRLRLELEESLLLANQTARDGGDPRALAERLGSIGSRAGRTALGGRIAGLARSLESGGPEDVRAAAVELASILRELSRNRGRRLPLRWIGILPDSFILPASAAIGLAGAAVGPLSPAAPLLSVGGLIEALLFFALGNAGLRLVRAIGDKIHDIRSRARFRTILVTDRQALSWMGIVASLLYREIGHLVTIYAKGESDGGPDPTAAGACDILASRQGLADALTPFADHADQIVVDTADESLAAEVRSLTGLPPSRYLALGSDGKAPPGYRWIDPRTLLIFPSDRRARDPGGDPYLWGTRRGRRPWKDRQFLFYLFAATLFALISRGLPLASFLGLAAICQILPDRLGPRRRSAIDRSALRAPRSVEASRRLVPRKLERRLWIVTAGLGLAACCYFVPPLRIDWHGKVDSSFYMLVGAALLAQFAGGSIVYAGLILRKWHFDWGFRILVLRRNSATFGYGHKAFVMATCGKYGQVVSLQDHSLDRTDEGTGEWRESSLGSWFRIFSEIGSTLKPDAFLHDWKRQVLIELEVSDFAVFDWIEEVTDNMRWELGAALDRLPAHRLLVIFSSDNEADLDAFLGSRLPAGAPRPATLSTARGRDDEYIWSNHDEFDRAFSHCLHERLAALVDEPRGMGQREEAGAWAYPRVSEQFPSHDGKDAPPPIRPVIANPPSGRGFRE